MADIERLTLFFFKNEAPLKNNLNEKMRRLIIFFAGLFFVTGSVSAQSDYVVHTITDGETLTKLANQYGTTVGDIMRLNKMTTESKLRVGEIVKIPTSEASSASPATHVVAKGETLYQISRKYKVRVSQLRDWNNIPDNTIKVGQTLYVSAPAAAAATVVPNSNKTNAVTNNTPQTPPDATDDNSFTDTTSAVPQNIVHPVVDANPYATAYKNQANGRELNTEGASGIFKSPKGWSDKNYFILMNDVTPGKWVKVQANGKTLYAKVLWNLANIKENDGLAYRISDAAAAALNLTGDTFDIVVSYFKEK